MFFYIGIWLCSYTNWCLELKSISFVWLFFNISVHNWFTNNSFAEEVVMISIASLIILFSVQRYNTSKVGLAVGPALFIWFCSLAVIGIFNLLKYGFHCLKAFSPVYIYYFFKRNPSQAWMSLGGCLLCATGKKQNFTNFIWKEKTKLVTFTPLSFARFFWKSNCFFLSTEYYHTVFWWKLVIHHMLSIYFCKGNFFRVYHLIMTK